jgi:3-(3-hydroxy-phenyl)propionate hydroxylase
MNEASAFETFDVAVVGLGPVGATLAHLLGLHGVSTLVLEREGAAYHLPRAVHFDDEIMRVFQWIGIADILLPKLRINPGMRFVDASGKLLLDWPRPQEASAHGWHPSWRVHQPDLEKVLRDRLADRPGVSVRTHCEAFMLEDKGSHVELRYEDMAARRINRVKAQYVVGCDGARSLTRRFIGSGMEDYGFHERWLVVDVLLKGDKPELGDHSIQYCNPVRPATYVRGPENRRRWEIAVLPGEDSQKIASEPEVWKLLAGWLTPDEAELERSAVYTFHSLIAEEWRYGRLLLAGDAAHQTPPFMGQGMCAGIRDAANLGWKLAAVVQNRANEALLDTYQSERRPNTAEFISTAVRLGRLINAADSETALRAAMRQPDGSARMSSIYPPLGPGLGRGIAAGYQFGQPRLPDGRRMDDVIGPVPLIVADAALAEGFTPPEGVVLLTTDDAPEAAAHLARFNIGAVLLRPDRYILGSANTPAELVSLRELLPEIQYETQVQEMV